MRCDEQPPGWFVDICGERRSVQLHKAFGKIAPCRSMRPGDERLANLPAYRATRDTSARCSTAGCRRWPRATHGSQIPPGFAAGAKLFAPITSGQYSELGLTRAEIQERSAQKARQGIRSGCLPIHEAARPTSSSFQKGILLFYYSTFLLF